MSQGTLHEEERRSDIATRGMDGARSEPSWGGLLLNGVTTLVIVFGILLLYHLTVVGPSTQRIAVVDLGEILQLKELEVTAGALGAVVTEEQGKAAFEKIGRFAVELEYAIAELQRDCHCLILVKAAVVKAGADDLTPMLKQRLGIANLDAQQLMQQIRASGGQSQSQLPAARGGE